MEEVLIKNSDFLATEKLYEKLDMFYKEERERDLDYSIDAVTVNSMPIVYRDCVQLVYILSGGYGAKISFNDYQLKAGDFLLVNPYELHCFTPDSKNNLMLILKIEKHKFKNKLFVFDYEYYNSMNNQIVFNIKEKMTKIYSRKVEREEGRDEIVEEIVSLIDENFKMGISPINNEKTGKEISNKVNLERIQNAYNLLYFKYEEKIGLKTFADLEHIDFSYASRLFKSIMGINFQDSVNAARIDRAEVFLLGTDWPISKISEKIGFASYDYFNKNFKFFFGHSASSHRKKYKPLTYPNEEMKVQKVFMEKGAIEKIISNLNHVTLKKRDYSSPANVLIELLEEIYQLAKVHGEEENSEIFFSEKLGEKSLVIESKRKKYKLEIMSK